MKKVMFNLFYISMVLSVLFIGCSKDNSNNPADPGGGGGTITGQAPGEFMRIFRLKKAAKLLLENNFSVTQIAYEVGFSSPSHFTKSFRLHFNCLPTEFIEKSNL